MSEDLNSSSDSVEHERSPSENVTIIAETFSDNAGATISSIKSEDSTKQLICKTPQQKSIKRKVDTHSATLERCYDNSIKMSRESVQGSKSLEASVVSDISAHDGDHDGGSKIFLFLGLGQLLIGIMMVVFGALVIVNNSSLSRVGAGLWSGCIGIATGMVGVLAGINDCYGLYGARRGRSSPFLTAFLALSLASLAAGNMAAVLAGTGIYRDTNSNPLPPAEIDAEFEDEDEAWTPVLTNIGLLLIASIHCLLSIISIYHASKRVCSCFRPKEQFNHNQFDPSYTNIQGPYVIQVSEKQKDKTLAPKTKERMKDHELCKNLERKLTVSDIEISKTKKKKDETKDFGSANSKDKLVTTWLGRHQAQVDKAPKVGKNGVRKIKMKGQPIMLVPAHPSIQSHPGSTMGRGMPMGVVPMGARYATLPLPLAPPHAYRPHQLYYPVHEVRPRRRRSPRQVARGGAERRARGPRNSQLTRSLERIHRKHPRDKTVSDAELKRTYTGLDRTIAEQFIAVCDETRNHPGGVEKTDSSGFDTASSECHSNRF